MAYKLQALFKDANQNCKRDQSTKACKMTKYNRELNTKW